jgi:glutamine amidotransferase PdxT
MKFVSPATCLDCVSRIIASLKTYNNVIIPGQQVYNLAFAFVPELGAGDNREHRVHMEREA